MTRSVFNMIPVCACILLLCGSATTMAFPRQSQTASKPTMEDVNRDLPSEIRKLADELANPKGLGREIDAALKKDGNTALATLKSRFEGWTMHESFLQRRSGDKYISVSLFKAGLRDIELGEMDQGKVSNDSGWKNGRRSFKIKDGATSQVTQIRASHNGFIRQRSSYRWGPYFRHSGKGIDWLIPVVGEDGKVRAHLVYSVYQSDYEPMSTQQTAVKGWKKSAEDRNRKRSSG